MTRAKRQLRRPNARRLNAIAGVIGLLVLAAAGYVSYTANSGLPFESRYEVTVELPNADRLIGGDKVTIGGTRVGRVAEVEARPPRGGRVGGPAFVRAKLSLEDGAGPLPADTRVAVRPASVLGASYVDVRPGRSDQTIADGGTLPLAYARRGVQLSDLFDIFERSTARDMQATLRGLGGGLAGRGSALNESFGAWRALLGPLTRVSRTLAASDTRLTAFVSAYDRALRAISPVSGELAHALAGGARTFGAIAAERDALGATIERFPRAERSATEAFTAARPALDGLAELVADLRPTGRLLRPTLARANATLAAGVPPMRQLPALSRDLRTTLAAVRTVTRDRATDGTVRKLTELTDEMDTLVQVVGPAQLTCNSIPQWAQGLASTFGDFGYGNGPAMAVIGLRLWNMGAIGEQIQQPKPSPNIGMNYTSVQAADECEAGNEPYDGRQAIGNPPGKQPAVTRETQAPASAIEAARRAGLLDPAPWSGR